MKKVLFITIIITLTGYANISRALPGGDTKGNVAAVKVLNTNNNRGNVFKVYFSNSINDRWGCIVADSSITVREDSEFVSPATYKQLYSMALTAMASGKVMALDSAGTEPCQNANSGWIE